MANLRRRALWWRVYLAEDSVKADQYMPSRDDPCYLFVSRVVMGIFFTTTRHLNGGRRNPSAQGCNGPASNCSHYRADSVLAESQRAQRKTHGRNLGGAAIERHSEFIVYDRRQTYPEVLVTVKRVNVGLYKVSLLRTSKTWQSLSFRSRQPVRTPSARCRVV